METWRGINLTGSRTKRSVTFIFTSWNFPAVLVVCFLVTIWSRFQVTDHTFGDRLSGRRFAVVENDENIQSKERVRDLQF